MPKRHYAWLVVAILWLVFLLNYIDRQVLFSLFPLLRADLRLQDYQLGFIPTALLWAYAVCSPLGGYLGDRLGRKRMVVCSLVLWSLMSAATAAARSLPQLLAAVALMGISEACYLPSGLALIADYHGDRSRSLATGIHQSGSYVGMVLAGVGGGWLGAHHGWRPVLLLLGAFGLVYGLVVAVGLREKTEARPAAAKPEAVSFAAAARELIHLPGFLTLTLVFGAMSVANWLLYAWMPLYLYEQFGMSLSRAGFSATFFIQIGSMAGILLGGWLADRFSRRSARSRLLTQAGGLLAAAPFLLGVGMTRSSVRLLLALVIFGVGRGAYDANCMPVLSQIAPARLWSTGYGLFNFAGCLAGGAIAAAAGALKSSLGLGGTMQVAAVLLFAAALLLLRFPSPGFRR
jgi:MFS family permease